MKKFVIFTVVFCVTTMNGFAAPQNDKPLSCTPNESYVDGCNTCLCDVSGQFAKCTQKACYFGPQFPDTVDPPAPQKAEIRNKRENTIEDENVEPPVEDGADVVAMNNQVCTPNEVKMEDCNRCKCANNGIGWFCTRKACPPPPTPAETRDKRNADEETTEAPINTPGYTCEPGSRFKDDCNSCKCDSTGTRAACSKKRCLPSERTTRDVEKKIPVNEPGFKCEPNKPFMDDCNSCTCDASGALARCTAMACDPSERSKRETEPEDDPDKCTPGARWFDGCNNCFCTSTGYAACTLKACFDTAQNNKVKRSDPKCEPGTTWKNDCNRCWCGETGIAACTLRGCLSGNSIAVKPVNPATHSENAQDTVKEDVRTEPKRVVTREEYENPEFTCAPLETFKLECNNCKCAESGKTAKWCTRKFCSKNI